MDFTDPKTPLQKLVSKRRGILLRLGDPSVPEEEKGRARMRLEETDRGIKEIQDEEVRRQQRRTRGFLKVDAF